jgi:hypothetical protein
MSLAQQATYTSLDAGFPKAGGNMARRVLAAMSVAALATVLTLRAEPPKTPGVDSPADAQATSDNITRGTDRSAQEYKKFEESLLRLVQRLERSPRAEDREKAQGLRKAIEIINNQQVENRFNKLLTLLLANKQLTTTELMEAAGQNEELIKILRDMLEVLLTDSDLLRKREEMIKLQELIRQVDAIIKAEKIEQTKMDGNRVASDTIAKTQNGITKATESVARSLAGKKDDPKKDPKNSDPKKAEDPKKGDPKEGDPKKGDPESGDPKQGDPKQGDPKKGDPKNGDPKQDDPKQGDPKQGDPKSGEPKQGNPMQGDPMQGDSQNQPPPSSQDQQAQKKIQEAIDGQKKVEDNLNKDKREDASKKTDDVIAKLEELKKDLQKRLQQRREEELERLLANLQARCQRMLAMQIEVQSGTKRVWSVILTLENQKPSRAEEQTSQQLSNREGDIVKEANKTLQLLSSEGSAVAFAMSLENVRDDMANIEKRLDKYDDGEFTQQMEQDVIDALKEMIEALKKAIQDNKDKKNNPKPSQQGPQPPQKLLDLLAELKLIRSQQVQVNKRTLDYSKHYQGEQTDDTLLQKELEQLSKRQSKLEDMLKKIATGKNQ